LNNLVQKLGGLVVQKYLEKPSLISGKKYDIRFFMLIACTKPYLVMTNSGYVRISLEDYTTEGFGEGKKGEKMIHLTNASVQRGHPEFKNKKEDTILSMEMLKNLFVKDGVVESAEMFDEKVTKKLDEVCRLTFLSVKDKLEQKFGCFELFGFDFILDEELNPHLIEINTNPALFTDTKV